MPVISNQISLYQDLMVVETIVADAQLNKTAGIISDMVSKVKDYVGSHVDPNDRLGSVMNILGPGAVSMAFRAMGMPWFGLLAGFAMSYFHINVSNIIHTIWEGLKGLLEGDKPVTSSQVDSVVHSAVQQHTGTDTGQARAFDQLMRDARMVKLAMIDYEKQTLSLTKEAARPRSILSTKAGTTSVLSSILSVLFKTVLYSAGLMVAADVAHRLLGGPSKEETQTTTIAPHTRQTKFPVNPSLNDPVHSGSWPISVNNDPSSIENMLINFAKEVYPGLSGKESLITASPTFQKILADIIWYNHASAGDKLVIIPKEFKNKKDIVDYFIDEVAKNAV